MDEAYWEFSGITVKELTRDYQNLLICRTFSKAFGLANFRIGYLISNPYNVSLINKIRNPKNISTFAQEAAIAALDDLDYMWEYVKEVKLARERVVSELRDINIGKAYDSQGNFVIVKFASSELKERVYGLLKSKGIYIRELTQRPSVLNCLRISVGTRKQMTGVLEVLRTMDSEEAL